MSRVSLKAAQRADILCKSPSLHGLFRLVVVVYCVRAYRPRAPPGKSGWQHTLPGWNRAAAASFITAIPAWNLSRLMRRAGEESDWTWFGKFYLRRPHRTHPGFLAMPLEHPVIECRRALGRALGFDEKHVT